MASIGIIFTAWQAEDLLPLSLAPWIAARKTGLGGNTFKIAAVSVPFEGFPQSPQDDTVETLVAHKVEGLIDHVICPMVMDGVDDPRQWKETEARGAALKWLVGERVDILIQWDADEIPTQESIHSILTFVKSNPWVVSFRLSLRNAVFSPSTFLAEPFTPMRIHRVHAPGGYRAQGFWDDNNVYYARPWQDKVDGEVVRDVEMASMVVPASVANPVHLTWLDDGPNGRSRRKIEYQTKARSWECSFRWDEVKGLQFNEAYYSRRGLPLPEVIHD